MWPFKTKKTDAELAAAKIREEDPEFGALFGNISHKNETAALYKYLSSKLHPDRFVGFDEKTIDRANFLFRELQKSRTDYESLIKLKNIADNEMP